MSAGSGDQTLTFPYTFDLDADVINRYLYKILQPGITEGGLLTNPSGDDVTIAPFTLFFQCSTGEMVKVQTTSDVTITTTETDCYLVYTLNWDDSTDHFGTFRADESADIFSNEIIFGKAIYTLGSITGFDYTERSYALVDVDKNVNVSGDLTCHNDTTIKNDLTVENDLVVTNNVTITEVLTCGDDIVLPSSAATTPVSGSCYFDDATDTLFVYNGVGWVSTVLT